MTQGLHRSHSSREVLMLKQKAIPGRTVGFPQKLEIRRRNLIKCFIVQSGSTSRNLLNGNSYLIFDELLEYASQF